MGCRLHKFFEVFHGIIPGRICHITMILVHAGAHVKHEYEMRRTYLIMLVVSYHEFRILQIESFFCIFENFNLVAYHLFHLVYIILTFQLFILIFSLFVYKLIRQFGESLFYLVLLFFGFIKLAFEVFKVTCNIFFFHLESLKLILLLHFCFLYFIQLYFLT
jgi:hypothetical protein